MLVSLGLNIVIIPVPLHETVDTRLNGSGRRESRQSLELRGVGPGRIHVPGLAGKEFLDGLLAQALLQNLDIAHEENGVPVADVIDPVRGGADRRIGGLGIPIGGGDGGLVEEADQALHDVVDIGEVPDELSLAKDRDGLLLHDQVGELEEGHVGPAPGSIDREESEPGYRKTVDVGIAVSHHLVGLLRGGVERDRMLRRMVLGEWLKGVCPVDRARGGVDQMAGLGPKRSLEDVPEAHQVRVDIGERILQGIPDPDLGGEVIDDGKRLVLEEPQKAGPVHDIHPVEGKALPGEKAGEAGLLEGDLVVVVQVVDPHHRMAHGQKPVGECGSDEAGGAGNQDFHKDLAFRVGYECIENLVSTRTVQ